MMLSNPSRPVNHVANGLRGVVGVGASAGGLEALGQFLQHVPLGTGLAFVIVQHLDPDRASALAELLQRATALPVSEVVDGVAVKPDHCYVAPPGHDVTLSKGRLHLEKASGSGRHGVSINVFFTSLAANKKLFSAGVVLSGMGTDGSAGAKALRTAGHLVLVQSPQTAEFPSMPQSVIDAQLADIVAPAPDLPDRLLAYQAYRMPPLQDSTMSESLNASLEKVLSLVYAQTGHDFSLYKKGTMYRRIQRRMAIFQLATVEEYDDYVKQNPAEAELLYKELLIGVTSFFRDPEVWQALKEELIALMRSQPQKSAFRAWVAGCSTGEEAYTLAMVFTEAAAETITGDRPSLQIFATDLEPEAVATARHGFYSENIRASISNKRLDRFFTQQPGGYRIQKALRAMVVFAQHSIARDPPFARLDILTCRNLLIYLEGDLQKKLLPLFQHSLVRGGLLVLGTAETTGKFSDLFTPLGIKTHIYRRLDAAAGRSSANLLIPVSPMVQTLAKGLTPKKDVLVTPNLQLLADEVLVRTYAPPAVLVTTDGNIVYFSGKTGKYLEPATGKANLNVFAMARSGISEALNEVFYRAIRQKERISIQGVTVWTEDQQHYCRLTVQPFDAPEPLPVLMMIVFEASPTHDADDRDLTSIPAQTDERVVVLTGELARSRQEHQSTREEMQVAQESLLSANEELQSTNEELTTSREEMQSINEELQTVNAELQARVDALAQASDDMENLLNSTGIATIFLDKDLNVRRFTTRATGLFRLRSSDVGRPITEIVSEVDHTALAEDAQVVLHSLVPNEREVSATGDRWFMVRTMPYRTQDHRIDGVVITFSDISASKQLETRLRRLD
jgi:two-component system CheB/CheR fusion protein